MQVKSGEGRSSTDSSQPEPSQFTEVIVGAKPAATTQLKQQANEQASQGSAGRRTRSQTKRIEQVDRDVASYESKRFKESQEEPVEMQN